MLNAEASATHRNANLSELTQVLFSHFHMTAHRYKIYRWNDFVGEIRWQSGRKTSISKTRNQTQCFDSCHFGGTAAFLTAPLHLEGGGRVVIRSCFLR